jgi:hypothetical protein
VVIGQPLNPLEEQSNEAQKERFLLFYTPLKDVSPLDVAQMMHEGVYWEGLLKVV